MGARLSQTNIYALSSLVTTDEWDIENILRRFEQRRGKWSIIVTSSGKELENIPHHANAAEPEFLIGDEVTVNDDPAPAFAQTPPPVGIGGTGGLADDSSRISFATTSLSFGASQPAQAPGAIGFSRSQALDEPLSGPGSDLDFDGGMSLTGGQFVSPMPSVFEGDPYEEGGPEGYAELDQGLGLGRLGLGLGLGLDQGLGLGRGAEGLGQGSVASNATRLPASYNISRDALAALLAVQNVSASDAQLLDQLFSLVDTRGAGETDLRDIMLAFCLVVAKQGLAQFFQMIFRTADRAGTMAIERRQMHKTFTVLNECIFYFGDRPLEPRQVTDLVDSVFTTAGKVDGHINWRDYLDLIEQHPILEMWCSTQFQGLAREKVWDPTTLAELDVHATFDYTKGR